MSGREPFSADEALFGVEQFPRGLDVELEHGLQDPRTNVSDDDPIVTGKIALAHLRELPEYYTRLQQMEAAAPREHERRNRPE